MTRIRIDRAALNKHLTSSPEARAVLDSTVNTIQAKAIDLTPVNTGNAKKRYSWRRFPMSRRLRNTDPFFHLIEFGSTNNPVYAPMRRAVRQLGMRFDEKPKP